MGTGAIIAGRGPALKTLLALMATPNIIITRDLHECYAGSTLKCAAVSVFRGKSVSNLTSYWISNNSEKETLKRKIIIMFENKCINWFLIKVKLERV